MKINAIHFLAFGLILLLLVACDKESISTPSTDDTVAKIIGTYVGDSRLQKWGYEEIHENMTGELLEVISTRDSSFSKSDTLIITKSIDDNRFTILGKGAIGGINTFSKVNFIYDMRSEFETYEGLQGYSTETVNLLFDSIGNVKVSYVIDSYRSDRPSVGNGVYFSGIKQ